MKLYEFAPTRSIRARWTLQELGVPFESVVVDMRAGEHRRPEFLALNPAGKLPVLVDGDLVLTESVAIVLYLGEKYADKGFMPTRLEERAELHKWLLFAATELEQPLWRIARNTNVYPKERRLPDDVIRAREDYEPMARILDAHLRGRPFVLGEHVSVADFVIAYTLDWANEVHLIDGMTELQAYLTRMYARPHAPLRIAAAFASLRKK